MYYQPKLLRDWTAQIIWVSMKIKGCLGWDLLVFDYFLSQAAPLGNCAPFLGVSWILLMVVIGGF